MEYVEGGMLGRKWTGGQSDAKDVEAILQEAIRECERKSGGQWKESLDTVRLRLVLSRYRSESGKVSADDERGLCQQVERILVKESKDAASDAASGFGSDLVAARLRERLTRFRSKKARRFIRFSPVTRLICRLCCGNIGVRRKRLSNCRIKRIKPGR